MCPLKSLINDLELGSGVGNKLIRGTRLKPPPQRASPNYCCWRQEYLPRQTTGLACENFDVLKSFCTDWCTMETRKKKLSLILYNLKIKTNLLIVHHQGYKCYGHFNPFPTFLP